MSPRSTQPSARRRLPHLAVGIESYELAPSLSTEQVVALLDTAADAHTRALRSASPAISPLLASIAASDAALAAAVRRSSR